MTYQSQQLTISKTVKTVHPQQDFIQNESRKIAKALGIYSKHMYEGHHSMAPYLFTDSDVNRIIDATVWFGSLYYLDDFFGEDIQHEVRADFDILFRSWKTGTYEKVTDYTPLNNLYRSIAYCSSQIQKHSTRFFFERYTHELKKHLHHSLHPTPYCSSEEYIQSRIHFGGMYPTMGMIEFTNQTFLSTKDLAENKLLTNAQKYCALIGVLSNDLISYHKESHSNFNLINAYLVAGEARDLDHAIDKAIETVNETHDAFSKAYNTFKSSKDIKNYYTLLPYFEGLQKIVAASYHWQLSTDRYRSPANIFTDLQQPIALSIQ